MTGKKTGGRQKGTLNKKTILKQSAEEVLADLGCNPLEILVNLTKSDDENIVLGAARELCKYVYTQKKAIEVTADTIKADVEIRPESLDRIEKLVDAIRNDGKD